MTDEEWHERYLEHRRQQKKLTRIKTADFLWAHRTLEPVLDVGGGRRANAVFFPNVRDANIDPDRAADFVVDAEDMSGAIGDDSFAAVVCISTLEHTPNPQRVLDEIYRVLRPGGKLLLSVPFVFPLHDVPGDYWRFTRYGVARLLARFENVEISHAMNSMETLQYLAFRMLRTTNTGLRRRSLRRALQLAEWGFRKLTDAVDEEVVRTGDGSSAREASTLSSDIFAVAYKPKTGDPDLPVTPPRSATPRSR